MLVITGEPMVFFLPVCGDRREKARKPFRVDALTVAGTAEAGSTSTSRAGLSRVVLD